MSTGYRFRPNDREIINDYLLKRMDGHDFSYVIRDIDLCRHEPWELPGMSKLEDDEVWYFFCRPDYKYRNSKRANRTTGSGYWKPTGKVRPIRGQGGEEIGTKRTLVFYSKSSTGGSVSGRTTWVIHEYQVHNVLPGQTEFVFCKLKGKEGEQTTGSILEEAEPGVQVGIDAGCQTPSAAITSEVIVHIQPTQDASDTEFDPNGLLREAREALASQGMSSENRLQVNQHPVEDSEDQVDPSFADSFLVDPEESVEHVHLSPGDNEQQRPKEHCNRVDLVEFSETESDIGRKEYLEQDGSSRMNDGHGSTRQFRQTTSVQTILETLPPLSHSDVDHIRTYVPNTTAPESRCLIEVLEDYAGPEFRGSPYQDVSLMHHRKWQAQALFPTTKSANPAKGYTLHSCMGSGGAGSCRNSVKVTDLKKVLPRQASASVDTKTSSFIHRKTAASTHPTTPESVYVVNMIVGLMLVVVFIIQMLSRVVPFW